MSSSAPSLTNPMGWGRLMGTWWSGLWNPDKGRQSGGSVRGASESNIVVDDWRAMQVSAVFSCIRLIAELTASLPLPLYKRTENGTREQVRDHWMVDLLNAPNPLMTGQELRETWGFGLAGWGNAYCRRVQFDGDKVLELWPMKPEFMTVDKPALDRMRYCYTPVGESGPEKYEQDQILHIKGFGNDGIVGMSPLAFARQALGLAISAERFAASLFANGGKPSGTLATDRILDPKQRDDVRKQFQGINAGDANRLWVLEAGFKYEPISIPPEDAQMLQTRQMSVSEIARFFRVPLFLLMEMEKSTSWGSGLEQQNLAFLAYTLRPYLTRIEAAINRWLMPPDMRRDYYVEHNVEALLRADSQARARFLSIMVQNGLMTRNEGRAKENLPPMPGGDVLTVQTNLTPADQLPDIGQDTPPPNPGGE